MSDTYGTCPFSVFDDERLDGDPGPLRAAFAMIMLVTDDWGLFEGDAPALARRLGCDPAWMEQRLTDLEERGMVVRYESPGRRRLVGEVVGYGSFTGHPTRKAFDSQRGQSQYPDRSGETIPGRYTKQPEAAPQAAASEQQPNSKRSASKQQVASKKPASVQKADGKKPATVLQNRREETRREEIFSLRSDSAAPQAALEPSALRSTDARARQATPDADPEGPAHPPALRAREEQAMGEPAPSGRTEQPTQVDLVAVPERPALGGADHGPHEGAEDEAPDPEIEAQLARLADTWTSRPAEVRLAGKGPPPLRREYPSVADYEAARQAWLGGAA